jgi:hypothetical protein
VLARPAAWQEAQRVQDTVITKGAIDVTNSYLRCQLAEDPRMPQPKRPAGAKEAPAGGRPLSRRAAALR